ncbi:MAG: DUF1905 domain-containing protein [Chloroflexi bacterium]|nr:DUF1905 domain-containing protein [Chloroflexota bacterium]
MTPSPIPQRFTATLRKLAMNYCVNVPAEASRALAGDPPERYVRVEGTANGHLFSTRLTPRGGGAYRLFLDSTVRAAVGIDVGDEVAIEVSRVEAPPEQPLPDDLREALAALDGGVEAFAALTEAQRTGMLAFVERARTASTRARYVERVVEEVRRRLGGDRPIRFSGKVSLIPANATRVVIVDPSTPPAYHPSMHQHPHRHVAVAGGG